MIWLILYAIIGVVACIFSYRAARRNKVDLPSGIPFEVPSDFGGVVFIALVYLALWPVVFPLWIWGEISAKKIQDKEDELKRLEADKRENNPNYGLSTDQQIDKLRSLHHELSRRDEIQSR